LVRRNPQWQEIAKGNLIELLGEIWLPTKENLLTREETTQIISHKKWVRIERRKSWEVLAGLFAGLLTLVLIWPREIARPLFFPTRSDLTPLAALHPMVRNHASRPRGQGVVKLQARPWAQVFINTVPMGRTPRELRLKPGRYQVELHHPDLKVSRKKTFRVAEGSQHKFFLDLERSDLIVGH
jgi:hypothetical protein